MTLRVIYLIGAMATIAGCGPTEPHTYTITKGEQQPASSFAEDESGDDYGGGGCTVTCGAGTCTCSGCRRGQCHLMCEYC
jgi:hypothetical protein